MQAFAEAIHSDDAESVSDLLEEHPEYLDAFLDRERQFTSLYTAAGYGRTRVTRLLLERGAKWDVPCSGGGCPIHVAASSNYVSNLETLVDAGCNVDFPDTHGNTPLIYASDAFESTKWLVEHGADVHTNAGQPLATAIHHHRYNVAELLCQHGAEVSLQQHIALGHEAELTRLILESPDILRDDKSETPLLEVAQAHGHPNIVNLLRDHGVVADAYTAAFIGDAEKVTAEIRSNAEFVNSENPRNKKPVLLHAAEAGQDEIISLLLEHGADLTATDELGMNLLHVACQSGVGNHDCTSTVKLALALGIEPNSTYRRGMTALHAATWLRNAGVVRLLLENRADPNHRDERGNRPLDFCGTRHHTAVREILTNVTS